MKSDEVLLGEIRERIRPQLHEGLGAISDVMFSKMMRDRGEARLDLAGVIGTIEQALQRLQRADQLGIQTQVDGRERMVFPPEASHLLLESLVNLAMVVVPMIEQLCADGPPTLLDELLRNFQAGRFQSDETRQ